MELNLPVTLTIVLAIVAIFVFANLRARQPAEPLKRAHGQLSRGSDGLHRAASGDGGTFDHLVRRSCDDGTAARRTAVLKLNLLSGAFLRVRLLPIIVAVFLTGFAGALRSDAATPVPVPVEAGEARFAVFLNAFREDALQAGIKQETYDRRGGEYPSQPPRRRVLNLNQPEFVRPVWEYLAGAVSDARVKKGADQIAANGALFMRLEQTYGVPAEILTAIWGLESDFGQSQGSFNLVESLATLAYDGPRADYGRTQLIAALKIADVEGRDPATMTGSWAGAFGQTQFVPTTFLERAVDGDGDGKRDVWNSPADALASTANYLKESGWRRGQSWGEEVILPSSFPYADADPDIKKPVAAWAAMGVRKVNGESLSDKDMGSSSIFLPAGFRGPAFLTRENFDVILKYNFATSYALAIGLLANRFEGGLSVVGAWPTDEAPLDQSARVALQDGLAALGFSAGDSDGMIGRRSRQAIRDFQKSRGLPADGFATASLLTRILNERAVKQ